MSSAASGCSESNGETWRGQVNGGEGVRVASKTSASPTLLLFNVLHLLIRGRKGRRKEGDTKREIVRERERGLLIFSGGWKGPKCLGYPL